MWVGIWCSWELPGKCLQLAGCLLRTADSGRWLWGVPVWVRPSSHWDTGSPPAAGVTRHGLAHGRKAETPSKGRTPLEETEAKPVGPPHGGGRPTPSASSSDPTTEVSTGWVCCEPLQEWVLGSPEQGQLSLFSPPQQPPVQGAGGGVAV